MSRLSDPAEGRQFFERWAGVLPMGIAIASCDGRIVASNARFREITAITAPADWRSLFTREQQEVVEMLQSGDDLTRSFYQKRRGPAGGSLHQHWHTARVSRGCFLLMVEDVTDSLEGRLELEKAHRLIAQQEKELKRLRRKLAACDRPTPTPALKQELTATVLDALNDQIVLADSEGRILSCNQAWRDFSRDFSSHASCDAEAAYGPGGDYFGFFEGPHGETCEEKAEIVAGIRSVLKGKLAEFQHEASFTEAGKRRWLLIRATALPGSGEAVLITQQEITARRKVEQDLRESHALFRHAIESSRDGIFMYDTDGRIVMSNSSYADALGLSVAQITGRTLFEVLKADLAQTVQEQNLLVLTTGQTLNFEMTLDTPRGKRNVVVSKGVYRNHRNEAVGIFGVAHDISGRRQVKETLEKSERHFRALIENSADRVCLLASDGTIRYASPSTRGILGFDIQEMVGSNIFLFVHPKDLAEASRQFKELLELPGGSVTGQYRALRKDGRWQWMEATATNLLEDPSVRAIVVNERDISERKQAEAELMRFAEIVQSSNDAIISADPEGNITSWNPAAQRIFGYLEKEILGRSMVTLIPPDREDQYHSLREDALRGRGANDVETVRLGKNGRRIEVSLTLSPIRDRERRIIGFSKIIRDITDRRRLEKEILEISDREKKRLGQDLHDDLCQHLVGISLVGNLLYQELAQLGLKQAKDARQVTDLVRQAVDHARSLARGLSPLQLAGSGLIAGLEALASSTEQLFRIPCTFECRSPVSIKNETVATHLYRITQEALHNAVKHSQASRVVVSFESLENAVKITVSDDGVGLPKGGGPGESAPQCGLGMHTMQYRARIIGATLGFQPNPGGGTRVICQLSHRKCLSKS